MASVELVHPHDSTWLTPRSRSEIEISLETIPTIDTGLEFTTGCDRALQQQPVEITPDDRATGPVVRVPSRDRDIPLTGDQHAVDPEAARLDVIGEAQQLEPGQRARIDRVAAEFVARERRAIDETHARAAAREDGTGYRTGRSRANDQDIKHLVIG